MAFDANNNEQKFSNFVHLHVHSDYSLLDGAAKIPSLVDRAVQLNMKALALTDHGNLFGAVKFADECKKRGIKPIIGEEFYVAENDHTSKEKNRWGGKYYHLILLCKDAIGYKNISWLSSKAYTDGLHYKPRIDFNLLKEKHEGLICLSACLGGELPQALVNRDFSHAESVARRYKDLFSEDYYIELQNHGIPEQAAINPKLVGLAKKLDIQLVITNDVHYCYKEDAESQDVLRCINFKQKLTEPHSTMGNGLTEWYLKSEEEMAKIFPDFPEALTNTLRIAEKCTFEFPKYTVENLRECLPRFPLPEQFSTQDEYVQHLVEEGLKKRYPEITEQIKARAKHELDVIFKMGFSGYFLVVWEFIHWAKENKIPIGPGRGSGAGSLVAYAMEITDIDPFRFNLLFERFLNPERVSMPDFDIDIDNDYRQAVIQHTRDLYGSDHVGHIVTFGTLKAKAVLADVGRVLGIPLADVNMLKKCIADDAKSLKSAFEPPSEDHPDNGGLIKYQDDERYKKLFELCFKLENINKNASLHASGMVISLTPLPEWAPVFKDLKEGKEGVQYTMDVIEEKCGLVKMDYLGLKTLSVIRYTEDIINRHKKDGEKDFHVADVSETDKETFEMFARGDTIEVFQFESAGMQKTLRQAQPTKLEDLVALNALYRPGPMDNIPKFIEGRFHPDKIVYPDECLKDILEETYGIMVYQEQVMQVAQRIAGFTLGEADILRRAMG
ncbi:MAG: DNA polymerase III subunit alpha, partial [Treponema sp.]|nr:DNA polymerase III subunit alpha [Treponema sp.]